MTDKSKPEQFDEVACERAGPVRIFEYENAHVIMFDRPEMRNPIPIEVIDVIERLLRDKPTEGYGKLIFTGRNGVFAAGADLRQIGALTAEEAREFSVRGQGLMKLISDLSVSTIAAIDGFCYGGALDLALSCRLRIASPNSTFCHPGARLGIITGWGGTQRMPRLIGEANALELLFTAEPIGAERALQMGLIDEVADDPLAAAIAS